MTENKNGGVSYPYPFLRASKYLYVERDFILTLAAAGPYFNDRVEAGKMLASKLLDYAKSDTIVLAIPRGGVVVGYHIAHRLGVFLDILVPRKIGAPHNPELAIGAVAEDGTVILDRKLVKYLRVTENYIRNESSRERLEIERRLHLYRGDAAYPEITNHNVILVDDGIATGSTVRAALAIIHNKEPKSVVIAVPVAPPSTIRELERETDQVICLFTPEPFYAIGQFYRNFTQTSDEEVVRLLKLSRQKDGSQ